MGFVGNNYQKKGKPQGIPVPVYLPDDASQALIDEICAVLSSTPFHKISIPLYAFNADLDGTGDTNDTRTRVVGFIKKYDAVEGKFVVSVFQHIRDTVLRIPNLVVQPQLFTNREGKLNMITRLVISSMPAQPAVVEAPHTEDSTSASPAAAEPSNEVVEV